MITGCLLTSESATFPTLPVKFTKEPGTTAEERERAPGTGLRGEPHVLK